MDLDKYIADEMAKYKGTGFAVKSSRLRRFFIRSVPCDQVHPNPMDEFCDPEIGPNYEIISKYRARLQNALENASKAEDLNLEPIVVERMYPDGYMIINGHHRWAAALMMGRPKIAVKIVNLTHENDIRKMISRGRNNRRVTLDLDEVVFGETDEWLLENPLSILLRDRYKERLRIGVPALFNFLSKNGYDIWVYSAEYYSMDYLKRLFRCYHAGVKGVVTGTGKKVTDAAGAEDRLKELLSEKYYFTLHIDNSMVLQTYGGTKEFRDYELSGDKSTWSQEIMKRVEEIEERERKLGEKMRVSFDLDEVLFVSPLTHKTEPELKFPYNRKYKERLRLGTPDLINSLRDMGYEVWIYTSSFRTENYIRGLFRHYGVELDGVVNATRHLKEVQKDNKETLPQKIPSRYRISLHVDDESVICSWGSTYGFSTYQLEAQDDEWKDKIIARAEEIRKNKITQL